MAASPFSTLEEYFAAVRDLIAELEARGLGEAAAELRAGYRCLNGLTDGWALFLESIDEVLAEEAAELSRDERRRLAAIRGVARGAVRRR